MQFTFLQVFTSDFFWMHLNLFSTFLTSCCTWTCTYNFYKIWAYPGLFLFIFVHLVTFKLKKLNFLLYLHPRTWTFAYISVFTLFYSIFLYFQCQECPPTSAYFILPFCSLKKQTVSLERSHCSNSVGRSNTLYAATSVTRLGNLLHFGQRFKAGGTIILPTFLGNFCKGVKIFHFSSEIILGNFCRQFCDFFLVRLAARQWLVATQLAEWSLQAQKNCGYIIFNSLKHFSAKNKRNKMAYLHQLSHNHCPFLYFLC